MHDDLTTQLKIATEAEPVNRPPDLAWVVRRGRRLRTLRLASISLSVVMAMGVLAAALIAGPLGDRVPERSRDERPRPAESPPLDRPERKGGSVEEMTEREQAEVFAFRALAATGLMNPFGKRSYLFTYRNDTTGTNEGWRVGFAASDCEPRKSGDGYSFTCTGLSGEDEVGNALTDTFVTVTVEDRLWRVTDVDGNMPEKERERAIGHASPQREEPSHWEFPAVGVWPSEDGIWIEMIAVWVGPYPTSAPGSVCEVKAFDQAGQPMGERLRFYQEPPGEEFERAGWIRGTGMEATGEVARAIVTCRQYTGRGWEVASDPKLLGRPGDVSGVTAELIWRGEKGFTAAAVCRATLAARDGSVVWEGSGHVQPLWRPSELRDYPYRTNIFISVRGQPMVTEEISRFNCRTV